MLDGAGWGAHAIFARGIGESPTSRKRGEKWGTHSSPASGIDFAAWAAGLFLFLAIYDARVGTLRYGICAGHVGSGLFGSSGGD
jgi:hypothetical protein